MSGVGVATADDIDDLAEMQLALFREDAAVHDRFVDLRWPETESRADLSRLCDDEDSLVLVARVHGAPVGYLAGYITAAPPTRFPGTHAMLRSLYVEPDHRHEGLAGHLTERFVSWARDRGCNQVRVDCYAGNAAARRLYERHGFAALSVSNVRYLE